jgi:hypothetical protein
LAPLFIALRVAFAVTVFTASIDVGFAVAACSRLGWPYITVSR